MIAEPLPEVNKLHLHTLSSLIEWTPIKNNFCLQWLRRQVDKVSEIGIFPADKKPNHVLINEYLPGQGIMVTLIFSEVNLWNLC
jgi:hypothetical protein